MSETLHIVTPPGTGADDGRHWLVRIVYLGDRYGRDDCLVHGEGKYDDGEDPPLVEFYDRGKDNLKDWDGRGQFVSRYCALTLLGKDEWSRGDKRGVGLDLMGYEPAWKIDGKTMDLVKDWVEMMTDA